MMVEGEAMDSVAQRDFPSGLHGGASINTPHPNTTATSSLVTRFCGRVALDIDKACDGHRRGPPGAVAFTFRLGQSLLARHVDSRPQTLVYKLVIAASKKLCAQPGSTRRCLWAPRPTGVGLGACFYLYYRCGMKVKRIEMEEFAWMDRMGWWRFGWQGLPFVPGSPSP